MPRKEMVLVALGITRRSRGAKCPGLRRFIQRHGGQWVAIIGDVRHPVAHSALRLQQDLVVETEESKKSDEEIAGILRHDDPDLIKALEPMSIYLWRMSKMKVISDDAIYVERAEGGYFRSPVASLDFDLERLNAFIDAFLIGCFAQPHPADSVGISTAPSPS